MNNQKPSFLNDASFLKEIDNLQIKNEYIKVIILSWDEKPIQEVQGYMTGGTLNIDGSSSMRRNSNITMQLNKTELANITDINNLFSINKKIALEIGIKNPTNQYKEYPILWYPQGIFLITSISLNHSANGVNISMQIKDKTCLLNGECGGVIPASTQFDEYETTDETGKIIITKPTIAQIIKEVVNHFGKESLNKILISDLDDKVKTVMKWIGSTPVYLINKNDNYVLTTDYSEIGNYTYETFTYGDDIGFIYSDFTYPKELIENAGSNVCTVLDKIKSLLGNYEYFYDIYGNFIFREIKNYLNTTKATVDLNAISNNDYLIEVDRGKNVYDFNNSKLISSYANTPAFNEIKNDFIVWGIKKTNLGNTIPIRFHLAIDKKPKIGNFYNLCIFEDPTDKLQKLKNPIPFTNLTALKAIKGMEGLLYLTLDTNKIYKWENEDFVETDLTLKTIKTTDWRTELYIQGIIAESLGTSNNYYYPELAAQWPKIYDFTKTKKTNTDGSEYYEGGFKDSVLKNPYELDYYLDFIDSEGMISQFDVNAIGRRSLVENKSDINCIFEPTIPDFIIIEKGSADAAEKRAEAEARNQKFIQVDSAIYEMLAVGGVSNSAYNEIKSLLYRYTNYNSSIQLQILPIYHLEPNSSIHIIDPDSNLNGDYLIKNISIPLSFSGTMSISGGKIINKL